MLINEVVEDQDAQHRGGVGGATGLKSVCLCVHLWLRGVGD